MSKNKNLINELKNIFSKLDKLIESIKSKKASQIKPLGIDISNKLKKFINLLRKNDNPKIRKLADHPAITNLQNFLIREVIILEDSDVDMFIDLYGDDLIKIIEDFKNIFMSLKNFLEKLSLLDIKYHKEYILRFKNNLFYVPNQQIISNKEEEIIDFILDPNSGESSLLQSPINGIPNHYFANLDDPIMNHRIIYSYDSKKSILFFLSIQHIMDESEKSILKRAIPNNLNGDFSNSQKNTFKTFGLLTEKKRSNYIYISRKDKTGSSKKVSSTPSDTNAYKAVIKDIKSLIESCHIFNN